VCTSFAAYFQNPIYAANIDHPDRERKFKITKVKENGMIIFHCQNRENNRFVDTACMNSLGMFSNYQILTPNNNTKISKPKSNKLAVGNLYTLSQMYMGTISELLNRIGKNTVYHNDLFEFRLHNMFADIKGQAVILETNENGNAISYIHDKHIVMTNFPVCEFEGKPYSDVYGEGSDRYKIAHDEIIKNKNNLGVKQAFCVLEKARYKHEYCPTVCSMVFDPINLYVYIALFGVFEKIWRVSLIEDTLETFSGFDKNYKFKIGSKGILASELEKYIVL